MIQFLQPIWLWAIGAIAVPLFIHLWNIRQGKTLKVGSIALLSESTRAHARSLRLSELLLLLLRCLLLILLALLLSGPVWVKQQGGPEEKGWVLIGGQRPGHVYAHFRTTIDSLLRTGYTLHRFAAPFGNVKLTDTLSVPDHLSYWATIDDLNQYVPASLPVHVFTTAEMKNFSGRRPSVSLQLSWHTYAPADSISYTEKIFATHTDSVRTITRHSTSGGTRVSYKNTAASNTPADTGSLSILVYTDQYTADAGYVKAAFNAIRDFTQQDIRVVSVTDAKQVVPGTDWLFWLSEKPVPEELPAKKILMYRAGKTIVTNASLHAGYNRFELYRQVAGDNRQQAIWVSGQGETILGKDDRNRYHFYNRFSPQWNNLVWNEKFPALLYTLIGEDNDRSFDDNNKLAIDVKQAMPALVKESSLLPKAQLTRPQDISRWFWLLVFLLFVAERLVTYYSKKTVL